ncbi:UNVERIFIED_CONTAM: hypothetical protein RMT77_016544 [Armadillidium vulgare]
MKTIVLLGFFLSMTVLITEGIDIPGLPIDPIKLVCQDVEALIATLFDLFKDLLPDIDDLKGLIEGVVKDVCEKNPEATICNVTSSLLYTLKLENLQQTIPLPLVSACSLPVLSETTATFATFEEK